MKNSGLIRWTILVVIAAGILDLQAQTETNAPPPKPKWESTLTASLAYTRGNSKTLTMAGAANTQKKWDDNELKFGADGAYGEKTENGTTTADPNNAHGYGQYNRLFTERWFAFARLEAWHDDVADVEYRVPVSVGAGYYIVKKPNVDLDLEAGPGYVWQKQGGEIDNYTTVRGADNFNYKISDRAKFWQKTEVLPKLENFAYIVVSSEIGVSAALTDNKKLALTVTLNHTYDSQPAAGRLHNDTILKTGITYAF